MPDQSAPLPNLRAAQMNAGACHPLGRRAGGLLFLQANTALAPNASPLIGGVVCVPQADGNIGERMATVMAGHFAHTLRQRLLIVGRRLR